MDSIIIAAVITSGAALVTSISNIVSMSRHRRVDIEWKINSIENLKLENRKLKKDLEEVKEEIKGYSRRIDKIISSTKLSSGKEVRVEESTFDLVDFLRGENLEHD